MSSLSSVASTQVDLFSLLQQTGNNTQTQASSLTLAGVTQDSDPGEKSASSTSGHHHHGDGRFGKIQSAVTTALQSAPPGSDPNQVIQNAIADSHKQGSTGQGTELGITTCTQDPATTPAPSGASSTTNSPSAFESLLSSFGVDAQQFSQDFKAAVQQSGVPFPPGSQTDVVG